MNSTAPTHRTLARADRHLIALDIDGTVMPFGTRDGDGTYLPAAPDTKTSAAIRTLHQAGHEVVLATGRAVEATLDVIEQLRIQPEWVVACNGAVTLQRTPHAPRTYHRTHVEAFDPSTLLLRLQSRLASALYGIETADGEFLYTSPIPSGTLPKRQRQVTFEALCAAQAIRLLVVSPDHALQEFLDIAQTFGLTRVSYAVGLTTWFDIAPEGVSKASALERVRRHLDIETSQVFAAGDGENDVSMLRWAGKHGGDSVAMGQAAPAVRAAAQRTVGTVFEGGLARALSDRFAQLLGS